MRRLLPLAAALVTVVSLVACGGDSTGPLTPSWAMGEWAAVRMNGQPLPYQRSFLPPAAYPYFRDDSLILYIIDPPAGPGAHVGSVFPYSVSAVSALLSPTRIDCYDSDVNVSVSATGLSTWAKGAVTTGSGCNASFATFNFTRKGDSLAGTWDGVDVRLIRRR